MAHVHDYVYDHCHQTYVCDCGDTTPSFNEMIHRLEMSQSTTKLTRNLRKHVLLLWASGFVSGTAAALLTMRLMSWH